MPNNLESRNLRDGLARLKNSQGSIGVLDTALITVFAGLSLTGSTIDQEDRADIVERGEDW